jgi:hypothetical protein
MPYRFRVQGVNRVGSGDFSPQSAAITPLRLPTAPLNLVVVAGNAELDFSWTAPTDDGEDLAGTDSIVDYLVEYSSDAGVTWTAHTSNPTSSTSDSNWSHWWCWILAAGCSKKCSWPR